VERFSKTDRKKAWFQYTYDPKGNLSLAKNDKGKGVQLIYDRNGRISSMIDESKRRIDFKYDQNSKPIEIIDPKLGSIKVTYTNTGEVKSVDSSAGRRIALQVTSAFQNLLDIIRPAGVTLSF
jgi:YD repeat-containing protein